MLALNKFNGSRGSWCATQASRHVEKSASPSLMLTPFFRNRTCGYVMKAVSTMNTPSNTAVRTQIDLDELGTHRSGARAPPLGMRSVSLARAEASVRCSG